MRSGRQSVRVTALGAITTVALLCLLGREHPRSSFERPIMTALPARLQPLFHSTKTICFSHFTAEVPATATVVFGPAEVEAPIIYYPGEGGKINERVTDQLISIEKDRKFLDRTSVSELPLFGTAVDGVVPGQKLVFGSKNRVSYTVYSFIPVSSHLFVQELSGIYPDDDEIKTFNAVASSLRLRSDDEIPTEPGTCIDGGFVPLPLEYEKVTIGVRLREFPDVHFSIEVHKNQTRLPEFSDLETRLKGAENDGGNWHSRVKFFRRGPRQIGNWTGSEALALKPAQPDQKEAHEFHFISLGAPDASLQPKLDIQLDTGASGRQTGAVKPSLSDEEALALWDKLTGSIRVRPTGGKQRSKTPLASVVATGAVCPESGWWQCNENGEVEGGRRKHIAADESMPYAIRLGEPSLWQKLKGERPRHRTATDWQLVEYDEQPPSQRSDSA